MGSEELEQRTEELKKLHLDDGMSIAEAGRRLGMSRQRAWQIIRGAGVSPEQSRKSQRIPVTCEWCGKVSWWPPSKVEERKFCDRQCAEKKRESVKEKLNRFEDVPQPSIRRNAKKGHLECRDPVTGKTMRYSRFVMQTRVGRVLESNEWVVALDGNDENVSEDNLVIASPQEAAQLRAKRMREAKMDEKEEVQDQEHEKGAEDSGEEERDEGEYDADWRSKRYGRHREAVKRGITGERRTRD